MSFEQGVPFSIPDHNAFVAFHGQTLNYYSEAVCPCQFSPYSTDPNRPLLNCQVCQGGGHVYTGPTTIIGLVTSIRNQQELIDIGVAAPGDFILGMPPTSSVYLKDFDIVQIPEMPLGFYGQVIVRGAGATDTLAYTPSVISRVFSGNPATGATTNYTQGTDFTVSGKIITWVSGHGPNPTSTYSISYNCVYDWVLFVSAMERFDGSSTNLGQRAILRKRDVVFPPTVA